MIIDSDFTFLCVCAYLPLTENSKTMKIKSTQGGYISALAVHGAHRGKGIAKLLMAAAVEQIKRGEELWWR
jgi:ribosomal protein S18 acetylase RimI-like enzyme